MKNLINDIEIGGVRDALNILAKAGNEELFEKAKHQIGDSHPKWPQLKWTDLGGGKFGWRTGTGRGKRASTSQKSDKTKTQKNDDAVNEVATIPEMVEQTVNLIEKKTGVKLSDKEKYDIKSKVGLAGYHKIEVKSDWDISQEATEGLHTLIGPWGENKFKDEMKKKSIKVLQNEIHEYNKNIEKLENKYRSVESQLSKHNGTTPPNSLRQESKYVRDDLALEKCKKLHLENEINIRKKAANVLNDYIKQKIGVSSNKNKVKLTNSREQAPQVQPAKTDTTEKKDIKTLKTDDIEKIVSKLGTINRDISVKDNGNKFIVELNDNDNLHGNELRNIMKYFSETYNVDVDYDIETDSIEIHKKKFPKISLKEMANKQKQEDEAKQKQEETKNKIQSNGLTKHDEELIDLAHSTTYRSTIRKYINEAKTDKAKKMLKNILTDSETKWDD